MLLDLHENRGIGSYEGMTTRTYKGRKDLRLSRGTEEMQNRRGMESVDYAFPFMED
jgi:hypothetical protein